MLHHQQQRQQSIMQQHHLHSPSASLYRVSHKLPSTWAVCFLVHGFALTWGACVAAGGLLQGLNEDSLAVQQALSDKVGLFLQHMATFITGYIIAFVKGWDMTLVMVGCLPFLAGVGGVLTKLTTSISSKSTEAYTEVSSCDMWS